MGNPRSGERSAVRARLSIFYSRETWIDGRAEDQLAQVASWPGMVAVTGFPDLHPGRFGPVGAAFLADRIWPQLVGPDIGCGMALFRLDLPRRRLKVDKAARRLAVLDAAVDPDRAEAALAAGAGLSLGAEGLGTIGGGNHFCELQQVEQVGDPAIAGGLEAGELCLLVHSGSRGRGAQIFEGLDDGWKHGFAPESEAAWQYRALHDAALDWARINRALIAARAADALSCCASLVCDSVHNHVLAPGQALAGRALAGRALAAPQGRGLPGSWACSARGLTRGAELSALGSGSDARGAWLGLARGGTAL